ncbi:MAG: hypothetical protein IPH74_10075 [Bacteroidetes bacterium]|nr:hypothetical protein [Bacteroidota bacterium]
MVNSPIETLTFGAFNAKKFYFDLPEKITNENIPITWFVRMDEQININSGSYLYLLENNQAFFGKLYKTKP